MKTTKIVPVSRIVPIPRICYLCDGIFKGHSLLIPTGEGARRNEYCQYCVENSAALTAILPVNAAGKSRHV